MGQKQSARKLTISNEDEGGTIRISNALAQRLADSAASETVSPKQETKSVQVKEISREPIAPQKISKEELFDFNMPLYTITALQMQQQMENELLNREKYWRQRLQELKKGHENIDKVIDDQYKKALAIFDNSKVVKVQNAVKPCIDTKQKVLKCYSEYPTESLRCASLVQEFSSCVDQRRAQLMQCS